MIDRASTGVLERPIPSEVVGHPPPMWRPPIGYRYVGRQMITSLPLAIADAMAVVVSMLIWSLAFSVVTVPVGAGLVAAMLIAYAAVGLYPGIGLHPAIEIRRCTVATCVGLLMLSVWLAATASGPQALLLLWLVIAPCTLITVPLFRSFARHLVAGSDRWAQPVIIFGSGYQSAEIFNAMAANRKNGLRPLGFVDENRAQWLDSDMHPNWYLGTAEDAVNTAAETGVYWAVVAGSVDEGDASQETLDHLASAMPHRLYFPGAFPVSLKQNAQTRSFGRTALLYQCDLLALPGPRLVKRLVDLTISLALATVVLPMMLFIGMLIKLSSPGPMIFAHQRLGRGGRSFKTLKFRTMRTDAAQVLEDYLDAHPELQAEWDEKHKLTVDPRVTRVGRVLRKSSLDELPQLINVIKGEMSLVGPRPIVENEIARYDKVFDDYCRVPPGVAGLWQVSGRNNTTYPERVACDRYYVQNWSLWLDLYLLARTVKVVITGDGAY